MSDALIARDAGGRAFAEHPAGTFPAVCVDVVDMGMHLDQKWGRMKHKVRIVFQTNEPNPENEGKPFIISQWFTLSLSEKAHLSTFLQSWFNKKLTDKQRAQGINLEALVGRNAFVQIVRSPVNGKDRASIQSIMALPQGMPPVVPRDYVRVKDRPARESTQPNGGQRQPAPSVAQQQAATMPQPTVRPPAPPLPPSPWMSEPGVPALPAPAAAAPQHDDEYPFDELPEALQGGGDEIPF